MIYSILMADKKVHINVREGVTSTGGYMKENSVSRRLKYD